MVVVNKALKFNPLPGVSMVNEREPGLYFCGFHQIEFRHPEWIIWENDYHAACPECFTQEAGRMGFGRAIQAAPEPEENIVPKIVPIRKTVVCCDAECGTQTYSTERCKVCKFAFCHKHLLKFPDTQLCRRCEEASVVDIKVETLTCQFCNADAENWCEQCKKRTCHYCQSSRVEYLCKECGGEVSS